jgi:pimeloyl-ACP methyl ester carboxylesterase
MDALASLQHEWAWEAVRAALFDLWTRGVEVPAVHDYVQDMGTYGFRHWSRAGREIAAVFAAEAAPLAALERLDEPCPTLHVYAQPRDDAFLAAQQDYSRRNSWFRVRRLDAASHFPTFEVPGAVADAVEEFVCAI